MCLLQALLIALLSIGPSDLRDPYPSPSGERIVLCYRGDLWLAPVVGGQMRCVVPGESLEYSPCWSPDGSRIAFTSDRTGGGDIYVMDASGGESTQLTFHAWEDLAVCFSAGSDSVYFLSSREGGDSWVWSVPVTGGTPRPVARVATLNACLHPKGLALERGASPWWRRHYSGAASSDLWTGSGSEWTEAAATDLDERWPMYSTATGELLFVKEDSSGNGAIWSMEPDGVPVQRTFLDGGDITFPGISADGGTVVFEYRGGLESMEVPGWTLNEVELEPDADFAFPVEYGDVVGYSADFLAVDSSGTQIAVVAMGCLFEGLAGDGEIEDMVEVSATEARAMDPVWSPDGTRLAFCLEHEGRVDLAIASPFGGDTLVGDRTFPEVSIIPTSSLVSRSPEWSPDGSRISYLDQNGSLHALDVRTGSDLLVCPVSDVQFHSWSPDGRWLAFSVPILAHREEIFIVPSSGGEPVNVSRHPNDDFQPFWPSDGRRLLFASRTDEGDYSIRQIWLRREDWDLDMEHREDLLDQPAAEVEIEWEGLQHRTETLCTVTGYYDFFGSSPDGKLIAFPGWDDTGLMDLWSVDWKGEGLERLTWSGESPTAIQVLADGTIFYISIGGTLRAATSPGGILDTFGWRMPVWLSIPEIQIQKFDEAWRLLRDNFYDSGMHNVDWDAVREEYRDRAANSVVNEDFNDVVRRMLGELSASHLGIWGPGGGRYSPSSGTIGIFPDHDWEGPGIRVDSIVPYSPADREGSRLEEGDVILSVQGMPVGPEDNFYRALLQRTGSETVLSVRRGGMTFDMTIEPISEWTLSGLLYDEWVARNRRTVSRLTDGRVGYLHIPSMDQRSVEVFLSDLFAEGMDREGMIIDVRNNGGGSTHDQILRELGRPEYAYSMDRSGSATFEPLGVWQKPLVLLINERCYSDGEIFPAGWKQLGLGPIVGESTFGAVIGTVDVSLIDGTEFRVPSTGWYTLEGQNLENTGVTPDYPVAEQPADAGLGVDRQLEAAALIMLQQL
jgi:tricorn protease